MTVDLSSTESLKQISLSLCRIAELAGKKALAMRDTARQFPKGDLDGVTEADFESQEIVIAELASLYPDVPVVAEEQDSPDVTYDTFFAVDPIDGTVLYSRNGDQWAVMIGLIVERRPVSGSIYFPVTEDLIHAAHGSGCYFNGQKVALNQDEPLKAGVAGIEIGWWLDDSHMANVRKLLNKCRGIRSNLAFAADVKDLLMGVTCCNYHQNGAKIWDFAAGAIAVTEAGGIAVSSEGADLSWDTLPMDMLIASSQHMADEVLAAVSSNS